MRIYGLEPWKIKKHACVPPQTKKKQTSAKRKKSRSSFPSKCDFHSFVCVIFFTATCVVVVVVGGHICDAVRPSCLTQCRWRKGALSVFLPLAINMAAFPHVVFLWATWCWRLHRAGWGAIMQIVFKGISSSSCGMDVSTRCPRSL